MKIIEFIYKIILIYKSIYDIYCCFFFLIITLLPPLLLSPFFHHPEILLAFYAGRIFTIWKLKILIELSVFFRGFLFQVKLLFTI